jgi:DNA repair exonuclease SbcCD ATPase subunit
MPEMPKVTVEQLRQELASEKAKLITAEQIRGELEGKIETFSARLDETKTAKIRAEAVTEEMRQRISEYKSEINELRIDLNKAQEYLRKKEGEIGRLCVISENAEIMRAERDKSLSELAQVKADAEYRIVEEVKAALERANKEYEQASARWVGEKKEYQAESAKLKEQLEQTGVEGYVFPTDLASQFAKVLEDVAESKPAPGRQFSAALTAMEVEAMGVLEAPRKDEKEPRFVTVDTGKVDPAALSKLRMNFKILPRLVSQE